MSGPVAPGPEPRPDDVAAAWVAHLRAGGVTPWRAFVDAFPRGTGGGGLGRPVPGAAQLELLRRLTLAGGRAVPARYVDGLLGTAGPGRGPGELPLLWPADPAATARGRSGVPVDPARLPAAELLRIGAPVLMDVLPDTPLPAPPPGPEPGRRPQGSFVLDGAPLTVDRLRAELAAAGHVEHVPRPAWWGGRPSRPDRVLLAVRPLEDLLAEVWSRRTQEGAARRWFRFVDDTRGRGVLPPAADLAATARWWAEQVGPERVHLVCDPAALPTLVGRARTPYPVPRRYADLDPWAVDVLRRHNEVAGIRLPEPLRAPFVRQASALLEHRAAHRPAGRIGAPRALRPWVAETGERLARELSAGGYAVHGDLGVLGRVDAGRTGGVPPTRALPVLLDAVLVATGAVPPDQPSPGLWRPTERRGEEGR